MYMHTHAGHKNYLSFFHFVVVAKVEILSRTFIVKAHMTTTTKWNNY